MSRRLRKSFTEQLARLHPGHIADPSKPKTAEIMGIPPRKGLRWLSDVFTPQQLADDGLRHSDDPEYGRLIEAGDRFIARSRGTVVDELPEMLGGLGVRQLTDEQAAIARAASEEFLAMPVTRFPAEEQLP